MGPELADAARQCVDATGVKINWDVQEAGVDVMARLGTPLPDAVLESVRRTAVRLKAPITTPVGTGFRSINVHLRQELDLYACVRPCKHYPGVRSFFSDVPVDLVIVRENTEDLYAGIEFERGKPETGELIDYINRISPRAARSESGRRDRHLDQADQRLRHASGSCATPSTTPAQNGRKKVTAVHKANIMKFTDGLFLATARRSGQGVSGHRVRGPHRRQHVHAARAEARTVRRAGAAEPLRRHPQRPGGRPGRRPGRGAGGEHRAQTARSSRPPTAAPRSTRARTRSIRRP